MSAAFDSVKQINAGVLNVGYAEDGPASGPAVLLLHGWPYDIHSFAEVAPLLAAKGYRVIVPYLRGYGDNTLPFSRHGPQRSASGARDGHDRADGRAPDRARNCGRIRLGRADGRHPRGALA